MRFEDFRILIPKHLPKAYILKRYLKLYVSVFQKCWHILEVMQQLLFAIFFTPLREPCTTGHLDKGWAISN